MCVKLISKKRKLGQIGEDKATKYLRKQGYKILRRNYRCPYGEIDIIAQDKDTIVFIEVKTRSNISYISPLLSITLHKQKQISKVALYYLIEEKIEHLPCRFDVISIVGEDIEIIKGAFERKI
jgi:putative endonuclease